MHWATGRTPRCYIVIAMSDGDFVFGIVEEQNAFKQRNRDFLVEVEELWVLAGKVFDRPLPSQSYADIVVYVLGRMALDSFGAIHILTTNAYGIEAQKLLRTMYEETVTMAYLATHPADVAQFVEYLKVEKGKLANAIKQTPGVLTDESQQELFQEIARDYSEVADKFTSKACPKCGRRPMPSWTKLNIQAMAERAGHNLLHVYLPCYVSATKKTHVTPTSVANYVKVDGDHISFRVPAMRVYSDHAIALAHWLLITVLEVQNEFFSLGLDEAMAEHDARLGAIWKKELDWNLKADGN
jgi:hypothetical protein